MSARFAPRTTVPVPPPPAPVQAAEDPNTPAPPNPLHDITQAINAPANVTSNEGDLFILDTVPDHRFPLLSWLFSIPRVLQTSAYATHPNASPASLLGYTYFMYIAMLFQLDALHRPQPSRFARDLLSNYYTALFLNSLLDLPVPAFASMEFEALRFFNDPLASNLVAIGSEAAFSFAHDFGRFFTAGTFFGLHSVLATLPGNTQLAAAQLAFTKMTVATVNVTATTAVALTPGHFFGTVMNDIPYLNWLNIRLASILNQSEIRTMASRPNAGRIPMFALPTQDLANINPYSFMMSISDNNIELLTQWIRNLSSFTTDVFPSSRPLRAYLQIGTPEVVRHLVFEAPPPTWHTSSIGTNTSAEPTPDNQNPFRIGNRPSTHSDFATARQYRTRTGLPNLTLPATNPPTNLVTAARPTTVPNTWHATSVMSSAAPNDTDPVARRPLSDDGQFATTPQAVIFEPTSGADATAHHVAVITSGKLIEVHDITSIVLATPHPRRNLYVQNTHYLLGAVAAAHCFTAITNEHIDIRQITNESLLRIPLGIIRGFYERLTLPAFRQGVVEQPTNANALTSASSIFSGATYVPHSQRSIDSVNVFISPDNSTHNVPAGSFHLWSSYRHYNLETETLYFLPTLRHIFGTQARTFLTDHPARRIPA